MANATIRFEREGLEGEVAVGTYLSDALKRFGIRSEDPCDHLSGAHSCSLIVSSGDQLLSSETAREKEHFSSNGRRKNERLACEAKISGPGEIVIMTDEKKKEATETKEKAKMVSDFENLPLEQKIANLLRMEAVTLSETVSYVVNSPFAVFEKVGDVMAEFGMKLEREAKKATRPAESAENGEAKKETPPKAPPAAKKGSGRAPRSPKA